MEKIFQWLIFTTIGVILVWFGYTLFNTVLKGRRIEDSGSGRVRTRRRDGSLIESGNPGEPRVCPVCSVKLLEGERVKSSAFPGLPGQGRMMHIFGCVYCLNGGRERKCPVCGAIIDVDEILVARMFEQPGRSHVHVLGCSRCREVLATVKKKS
ncbi:MAG: hypothetical protein LBT16_10795 [Treponema sp.]|nr:hypothetical protein [Treponema sp.]